MIPLSFPLIFLNKGLLRYLYWFLTFWLILLLSLCLSYGSMMILFSSFISEEKIYAPEHYDLHALQNDCAFI